MKAILFLLLFLQIKSFSQLNYSPHGTQINAIICTDGIIISADSRACFRSGNEQCAGYFDSVKKIFRLGKYLFTKSGNASIAGKYFSKVSSDFNKTVKGPVPVDKIFDKFYQYLTTNYPNSLARLWGNKSGVFVAGYKNNTPYIIDYSSGKPDVKHNVASGFSSGDPVTTQYIQKYIERNVSSDFSVNVLKKILDSAYHDLFAVNPNFGGPIYIVHIKPDNSVVEMQKFNFLKAESVKEVWELIDQYKIKVHFSNSEEEKLFRRNIKDSLKTSTY